MKKIFLFCTMAIVAMCGLNSCSEDCDHNFIEHDFTQDIVGTWTFVEEDLAEAMVIKADGSFTTTGVMRGGYLYEEKGTIKVVNNKITLAFDGDKETFEGRLEFVAGKSMSLVMFDDNDVRLTYDYCENDLSDEVIGMWVCNDASTDAQDMMIQTFYDNGKCTLTGYLPQEEGSEQVNNEATDYKVIGDLLFISIPAEKAAGENPIYVVDKLVYTPNGNAYGDILTLKTYIEVDDQIIEGGWSYLRVKQTLNLTGKTYAYSSAYVSNAKGADVDFNITGSTFNMANIKAGDFDMMFRSVLFCVNLNANSITQHFLTNGVDTSFDTPITVEGNKVTLEMSASNPAYRNIEMYMFQDADDTQLHIYMPTQSFINYFANLEVVTLLTEGKIDPTDAAAVAKVYADMEARVESINVSFVMKAIEPIK